MIPSLTIAANSILPKPGLGRGTAGTAVEGNCSVAAAARRPLRQPAAATSPSQAEGGFRVSHA